MLGVEIVGVVLAVLPLVCKGLSQVSFELLAIPGRSPSLPKRSRLR
jgi:hypothetical protein